MPVSCKNDRSAFAVVSKNWVTPENMKAFDQSSQNDVSSRELRSQIQKAIVSMPAFPTALWNDVKKEEPRTRENLQWMKEHLLNCRDIAISDANGPALPDAVTPGIAPAK